MRIGIIHRYEASNHTDIEVYKKILAFNNIDFKVLNVSDSKFWEDIKSIDRLIYKWANTSSDLQIAHTILPIIENHYNIKCFPSQATSWHYDDKIREYYLLKRYGYPMAESFIFWNKKDAKEFIKTVKFPLVHKLTGGSGSTAVSIVKSQRKAKWIVKKAFGRGVNQNPGFLQTLRVYNYNLRNIYRKYGIQLRNFLIGKDVTPHWMKHKNYVLFQKFYPNNTYDTRVQITGNRGYAFIRYNRENDFRASGSNNWSLDKSKIDLDMVRIAFEISQKLNFQSMAYDFIYDENKKPVIVEISYCYGDYPEFSTGYWDPTLNWHDGSYLPQYLELIDLLEMPELKQPIIEIKSEYKKAKIQH